MAWSRRRAWWRPGPSRRARVSPRRSGSRRARRRSTWSGCGSRRASPSSSSRSTFRRSDFLGLLATDLEHGSLYDLLAERYDTRIVRARESLEPVLLHTREAKLLAQPPRTPALLVEGIASTAAGEPVEFSRSYVRGDRTRYYIERIVVRDSWLSESSEPEPAVPNADPIASPAAPAASTRSPRRSAAGAIPR